MGLGAQLHREAHHLAIHLGMGGAQGLTPHATSCPCPMPQVWGKGGSIKGHLQLHVSKSELPSYPKPCPTPSASQAETAPSFRMQGPKTKTSWNSPSLSPHIRSFRNISETHFSPSPTTLSLIPTPAPSRLAYPISLLYGPPAPQMPSIVCSPHEARGSSLKSKSSHAPPLLKILQRLPLSLRGKAKVLPVSGPQLPF